MTKKYIQTGITPEFEAPHDVGRAPYIDVPPSRFAPGDRVYIKSLDELGRVHQSGQRFTLIHLDSRPTVPLTFNNFELVNLQGESCPANFAGQDQDEPCRGTAPQILRGSHGEYWIEEVYKTVNGKQYGPYRYKRWRDASGRKRSHYLGKAGAG